MTDIFCACVGESEYETSTTQPIQYPLALSRRVITNVSPTLKLKGGNCPPAKSSIHQLTVCQSFGGEGRLKAGVSGFLSVHLPRSYAQSHCQHKADHFHLPHGVRASESASDRQTELSFSQLSCLVAVRHYDSRCFRTTGNDPIRSKVRNNCWPKHSANHGTNCYQSLL